MRVRPDTTGFGAEAESGIKKSLGVLGKMAGLAFTAAMGAATVGIGIGVKVAADMETARIGFTTMLGSAEKADSFLRKLQKFAADTPFEFPELQTAASSLISIGIDADKVIPIMTTLGNVTSGMGTGAEGVKRATIAIQQMNAAGRITAEDLNQLRDAGIPVYDLLAAATGKSKEQVAELAQQGKLGRKELEQLMSALETGKGLERFNGLMEKQSQSLAGLFSTLKDTVQMNLAEMMTPLIPAIKGAMNAAAPVLDNFLSTIKNKMQVFVDQAPNLFGALVDKDAQGVAEVLDNILGNTGQHIAAIRTVAEQFFPVWDALVGTFKNFGDIARELGPLLSLAIGGGIQIAWQALRLFAPLLQAVTGFLAQHEWALYALVGAYAVLRGAMVAHAAFLAVEAAGGLAAYIAQLNIVKAGTAAWAAVQWVLNGAQAAFLLVQGAWSGLIGYIRNVTIIEMLTKAWAAVQWVLNAALTANPIGIVIVAIAALVAGLILAWQNSETFRNIVTGAFSAVASAGVWLWQNALLPAFNGIKAAWDFVAGGISLAWASILSPIINAFATAGQWLWNNVLAPAFAGIQVAWNALATGVQWAWANILSPVWEAIKVAAQILFAVLVVAIFGPILLAWQALSAGISWAWANVIQPAWNAVQAAAQWMWNNVLSPVFSAIGFGWNLLVTGIQWVWTSILAPVWNAVQVAAQWMWNNVLSPIFSAIGAGWDALLRGMSWVYNNILSPMFEIFKSAIGAVQHAFEVVVSAIGTAWDKIKEIAAKPINFVIGTVLNKGLFAAFNWVIDKLGLDKAWHLNDLPLIQLAAGGQVPGWSPNDKADNIPAMLTADEYVQPVAAHRYYGTDVMDAIRSRRIPREAFQHLANGGPVYQGLFNLVKSKFPQANLNSGARPGAADYHGQGKAVDLGKAGTPGGSGNSYLAAMNQWLYDNFKGQTLELIYDGAGDNRPDLKNGRDFSYSAALQAQHRNHVHWAANGVPTGGGGDVGGDFGGDSLLGGIWDSVTGVFNHIKDSVTAPLSSFFGQFGHYLLTDTMGETVKQMPGKAWEKIKEKVSGLWDGLKSAAGNVWNFITGGGDNVKSVVQSVANGYGWGSGPQWDALSWIIQHESGWNPNAKNPSSTAYGLFQFLDSTWGSTGIGRTSDPAAQANAGLRYIKSRYGSPSGAKAFWQAHNWYSEGGPVQPLLFDNGGQLNPGLTMVDNRSGKPEGVLNNEQLGWLQSASKQGNAPLIGGNLVLQVGPGADVRDQMDEAMFQLRRIKRGGGIP